MKLAPPAAATLLWPAPAGAGGARAALAAADAQLNKACAEGAAAAELVAARAWVVEQLALELWLPVQAEHAALALVAVGGFGRGELFPRSDVDLLVLLPDVDDASAHAAVERFFAAFWDTGLALGHAVRTAPECVAAAADLTVATALMEARCIGGNRALFDAMRALLARACTWPPRRYLEAKRAEQDARHRRFHGTAHNLEPNLKEGPGGLRDYQLLLWLGLAVAGAGSLEAMIEAGLLTSHEGTELTAARDALWRIRYALHLLAARAEERLLFEYQRELATRFGFHDEHAQNLAVEQFMQGYYRAAMTVERIGDRLWQRLSERLAGDVRERGLGAGFFAKGDYLERDAGSLAFEPASLLRPFWLLLEHPELHGLGARLMAAMDESLPRVASRLRDDSDALALFLAILRHPGAVDRILKLMARHGVLGALLPAFAAVAGRMQFDLFHVYTVDQHTLTVLEFLAGFARPPAQAQFPLAHELRQRLRKPELLYLAGLFHDIAKGRGGDHSELGEADARAFCSRLGLAAADVDLVAWLVREHLILSVTAQKQDLTDPAVVHRFATRVADRERLDYLYLLTVADINGTSAKLWNSWKDQLLAELYRAAHLALSRGLEHPVHAAERAAETRAGARGELQALGFAEAQIEGFWHLLPDDIFLRFLPEQLSWISAVVIRGARAGLPLVAVRRRAARGTSKVLVYSPDRDGLFATITAVLDRCQLSVVEARIMATHDGKVLDVFQVLEADGQPIADDVRAAEIVARLKQALAPAELNLAPSRRVPTRTERQFAFAPQIAFAEMSGLHRTQLALTAADRPGLLAEVAAVLRAHRVRVHGARIATFGARAEDVFELSGEDDCPLPPELANALDAALSERLSSGVEPMLPRNPQHATA